MNNRRQLRRKLRRLEARVARLEERPVADVSRATNIDSAAAQRAAALVAEFVRREVSRPRTFS